MTYLQAIFLGLIQGLTEFIPVSSSGHLVLAHYMFGTGQNSLAFDVALHLGTLLALLLYFYKDLWELFLGLIGKNDKRRLAMLLILATIPGVIAGVLLEKAAETAFRSPRLVAVNLLVVALIMLAAERFAKRYGNRTKLEDTTLRQAGIIGLAQAAAVVPGVSRSGSTIVTGLFTGMDRVAATRFSFLLGVPIIAGAIGKVLLSSEGMATIHHEAGFFAVGVLTAFISGWLAIAFLLRYLSKHTLDVFAYYRIALAVVVLVLLAVH